MSCEDIRERLTAYLDGDLDPDRGTVVRGHLRTCEACRQVSTDEAALRDGLRRLPAVDPPPSLWANVQAALAEAEVQESQRPAWRRALRRWMPPAPRLAVGGALAAAAIALVVWKVGASPSTEPRPDRIAGPPRPMHTSEHPSMKLEAAQPRPPSAPSGGDATADLLAEPARITATYEATADELLAVAKDARSGWTDDEKAAFDAKIAGFRDALAEGADERARQKTYRAMIRYVQNAVVRDEIMLARAP